MASIHETLEGGRKGYATIVAADPPRRSLVRRLLLPVALGFVLCGFALIVWLAWQDSFSGGGEPPLIRAAAGPIKRPPDTPGGVDIEGERHGVTAVLSGQRPAPRVERLLPREPPPPRTLAEADPALAAPATAAAPAAASNDLPPAAAALPGAGAAAAPPPAASLPQGLSEASRPAQAPRVAEGLPAGEPSRTPDVPPAAEPARPMPPPTAPPAPPTALPPAGTATTAPSVAAATAPPAGVAAARGEPAAARPVAASPAPAAPASNTPAPAGATAPAGARPPAQPPERLASREPSGPQPPAPPIAGTGPWGVQIAAVSSREAAERGWSQLQSRHPEVLGALRLRIDEARLANGLTLYRMQGLGFADRESAAQACARLKAAGTECFVVGGR